MQDRIPINILDNGAIRHDIYDDAGNFLRTEYIKKNDGATVTGTPLNKANLLTDETAALVGLDEAATPDEFSDQIANRIKAITGKPNWNDALDTTLAAAKTHIDGTDNPHGVTLEQVGGVDSDDVSAAILGTLMPYETISAVWNEYFEDGQSVTKTIAHSLGSVPRQVKVFLRRGTDNAYIDIKFDGTSYDYTMFWDGNVWKKEMIEDGYLFGVFGSTSSAFGTPVLGHGAFRLSAITISASVISFPIFNSDTMSGQTLDCLVTMEVYA